MKPNLLLIGVCLIGFCGTAYAKRGLVAAGYPTTEESYRNCKTALTAAKTDMDAFLGNYCVSQIVGYWKGYFSAIEERAVITKIEDNCKEKRAAFYEDYRRMKCLPKAWTELDVPMEIKLVERSVNYIERMLEKPDFSPEKKAAFLKEREEFGIAGMGQSEGNCQNVRESSIDNTNFLRVPTYQVLHQRCKHALKDSPSPTAFMQTYCAGYIGGLLTGFVEASWILPMDDPAPCSDDAFAQELVDAIKAPACTTEQLDPEWQEMFVVWKSKNHPPTMSIQRLIAEAYVKWGANHPEKLEALDKTDKSLGKLLSAICKS